MTGNQAGAAETLLPGQFSINPLYSADGKTLYFDSVVMGRPVVRELNLATKAVRPIAEVPCYHIALSPHGRRISCWGTDPKTHASAITIITLNGKTQPYWIAIPTTSNGGGSNDPPAWLSSRAVGCACGPSMHNLYAITLPSGREAAITHFQHRQIEQTAISRQGMIALRRDSARLRLVLIRHVR